MLTRAALYLLVCIGFAGGGLIGYNLLPPQAAWLTEILILAMFAKVVVLSLAKGRRLRTFGARYVFAFTCFSLVSTLYNDTGAIQLILYLRAILRFYVLLLVLINEDFDDAFMQRVIRLVVWCALFQIPFAFAKMLVYGQGETAIGTYARRGGGNSTVIPLVTLSFVLAYYMLHDRSKKYVLAGLGFVAFGIIGGKRGVLLLVPLMLAVMGWIIRAYLQRRAKKSVGARLPLIIVFASGLVFYGVARLVPTLNPEHRIGGRFSAGHVFDYVTEYTTTTQWQDGRAKSRMIATRFAMRHLARDDVSAALGRGPGTMMKSYFSSYDSRRRWMGIGIVYGITGLIWLLLQGGVLGAVAWLAFYVHAWRSLGRMVSQERDPFWQAWFVSMIGYSIAMLIISLVYNEVPLVGDLVPLIYMIFLGFSCRHRILHGHRPAAQPRSGSSPSKQLGRRPEPANPGAVVAAQ